MKYSYVVSECTDPYWNLAYEQCLFRYTECGKAVLYLWQNDNTIVVGRNQDVNLECRADEFMETGGYIARRRSGGGAVYHDMGNLNFSIICMKHEAGQCAYQQTVKKAVRRFGLDARYNRRNDLTVDGRKFSGNAVYTDGRILCQHGTILVSSDIGRMNYFLTPGEIKLEKNRVKSVSSRVVNLGQLSGKINIETMKQAMVSAVGAAPMSAGPSDEMVKSLEAFFSDRSWVFGGET